MQPTRKPSRATEALERVSARVDTLLRRRSNDSMAATTPLPGVTLIEAAARTSAEATVYRPIACLILRGRKETLFAGETARVRAGQVLLVSHDLPIVARIFEAPYLALVFEVEVSTLRSLYEEVGDVLPYDNQASALQVCDADVALIDALDRYLALTGSPTDARVLGAMLRREIHYRLLVAPFGTMLRNLIRHDSHASAVARAIAMLRHDLRAPMVVAKLARDVGMSVSSFHKHFKELTSSSPLQYQKDLRLLEARRRLAIGANSVTAVAFEVGYESPTQFSREYARKFGRPPSRDMPVGAR
jgi:AraC-like DNA-binding protein